MNSQQCAKNMGLFEPMVAIVKCNQIYPPLSTIIHLSTCIRLLRQFSFSQCWRQLWFNGPHLPQWKTCPGKFTHTEIKQKRSIDSSQNIFNGGSYFVPGIWSYEFCALAMSKWWHSSCSSYCKDLHMDGFEAKSRDGWWMGTTRRSWAGYPLCSVSIGQYRTRLDDRANPLKAFDTMKICNDITRTQNSFRMCFVRFCFLLFLGLWMHQAANAGSRSSSGNI